MFGPNNSIPAVEEPSVHVPASHQPQPCKALLMLEEEAGFEVSWNSICVALEGMAVRAACLLFTQQVQEGTWGRGLLAA